MKSTSLIVPALLATLLLGGCGAKDSDGDATDGGTAYQTDASPEGDTDSVQSSVNPVEVLRRVPECTVGAGVESGERDISGNLYASCEIEDVEFAEKGESYTTDVGVTVRAVDPANLEALGYEDAMPDDSHKVVFGDGFYLTLTASPAVFGTGAVNVEAIADAVDGQVV